MLPQSLRSLDTLGRIIHPTRNPTSGTTVAAEKVSISLPPALLDFVEEYRVTRGIKSRSEVIERALFILRERELDSAYREASAEVDPAWESTVADGLDDEAW